MKTPLALAAVLLSGAALAQKPCGKSEVAAAEKAIDRASSWTQMHKAYTDYRHCDAGPVEDQFTDALLRLAVDWKDVPTFAATLEKDAQYKAFVVKHLQSPAAKDDIDSIYSRAKSSCPAKMESFCAELADIARPPKAPPPPAAPAAPAVPAAAAAPAPPAATPPAAK
jgi:hypothetical protein